jgi:hypothetical protein
LLHRIDPARGRVEFVPTSRERLRDAAFIDGRSDFSIGPAIAADLAEVASAPLGDGPSRYIFHISFCGSTLLARLLDQPGRSLTLREPNCLVDLADWKVALKGSHDASFDAMVSRAAQSLNRRWEGGEAVTVKPSSWVNPILPDLTGLSSPLLPLFMIMGREEFLLAVLRGGTERLSFTARLAAHVAAVLPDGAGLVGQAIEADSDPIGKALHLSALGHQLQVRLFADLMDQHGWQSDRIIRLSEVQERPFETATRAAALLDLDLTTVQLQAACQKWATEHAKGSSAFSADKRREEDADVVRHHRERIASACTWAEDTLGKAPLG